MAADAPESAEPSKAHPHRNAMTLTRQQLYDLVWSKPMTQVAADVGLSDVAVAKRCRAVQVPVPPRGYWARVAAGQTPARTPLLKYRDTSRSAREARRSRATPTGHSAAAPVPEPTVHFAPHTVPDSNPLPATETPREPHQQALDARIAALPASPDAPADWFPDEQGERSPPQWPDRTRTPSRLPPIATHSRPSERRARRILTRLIEMAAAVGWQFHAAQPDDPRAPYRPRYEDREAIAKRQAHFVVEGEYMRVWISERQTRREHALTEVEKALQRRKEWFHPPRWDFKASGDLTLHIMRLESNWEVATLKDSPRRKLEHRIVDLLHRMGDFAAEIKRRRAQDEENARIQRTNAEKRAAREATRDAHQALAAAFERQAGAWHRAQLLRRYLRAARRALGDQELYADLQDAQVNFFDFAEHYINQLDPLHPATRSWEFEAKASYLSSDDAARLQSVMTRIMGVDWQNADKLVGDEASDSTENAESYD